MPGMHGPAVIAGTVPTIYRHRRRTTTHFCPTFPAGGEDLPYSGPCRLTEGSPPRPSPIEGVAVLRFCHMLGANVVDPFEICEGAGHPEDGSVGPGRQTETPYCQVEAPSTVHAWGGV